MPQLPFALPARHRRVLPAEPNEPLDGYPVPWRSNYAGEVTMGVNSGLEAPRWARSRALRVRPSTR